MTSHENAFQWVLTKGPKHSSSAFTGRLGWLSAPLRSGLVKRAADLSWQLWSVDAVEAGWLTIAVVIPLLFNPLEANAFELPKAATLEAIVWLMGWVVLIRIGTAGRLHFPSDRWLILAVTVLGAVLALASIFSTYPLMSLLGHTPREQGFITLVAYLALLLMTALYLRTRAQAGRLWRVLVWSSVPIIGYAFIQVMHLDPFDWQSDAASPIVSTLGRSNFVGTYLAMILPLTAARLRVSTRKPIYSILLAAQLLCLLLTQARGAWLGALSAGLAMIVLWAMLTHRRSIVYGSLVLVSACVVLLVLSGSVWVSPFLRLDEGSTAARLTIWRTTLPLVAERPWLGYGPETMQFAFVHVFPPQLVYYQGKQFAVDRAHNIWLDLAMSAGILGVGAFLALLLTVARRIWSRRQTLGDPMERWLLVALAAAVGGHLIDLEFGFDVTATATVFVLVLALAAALGRGLENVVAPRPQVRWAERLLFVPPAIGVVLVIGSLCVRPVLADVAFRESQIETNWLPYRIAEGEQAVQLWSIEPEYHLGLAWLYAQTGALDQVEVELRAAERLTPGDPRIWATRGDIYARWGGQNAAYYALAVAAYQQAIHLAPNVAAYHVALGWTLAQEQRRAEAIVALERAVALDATDGSTFQLLGGLYSETGRKTDAVQAWKEAARWSKR